MGASIYRPKLGSGLNMDKILSALERQGLEICNLAAHTHQTKRQTGNQENAYGYGVYYNGNLKRFGMARVWPADEPIKVKGKEYWGKEEILKFLHEYHPELSGFTLVVANAMFYSSLHEEGSGKRVYRIVSQVHRAFVNSTAKTIKELQIKDAKGIAFWHWTRNPSDYLN